MESMPPLEDKSTHDNSFMTLLSTQRNLLYKLGVQSHTDWMNASNLMIDTVPTDGLLLSKRTSLGIGSDDLVLPEPTSGVDPSSPSSYPDSFFEANPKNVKKRRKSETGGEQMDDCENMVPTRAKRRRSTLAFLNYLFRKDDQYVDHHQDSNNNINNRKPSPVHEYQEKYEQNKREDQQEFQQKERGTVDVFEQSSSDDDDNDGGEGDCGGSSVIKMEGQCEGHKQEAKTTTMPKEKVSKAKELISLFEKSMEATQDSQQKIHDWDRKMGLKRSHSKTMRLSARSRKNLRQICKKDIGILSKRLR